MVSKKSENILLKYIFYFAILFNYFADAINKYFGYFNPDFSRIGLIFRISFQLLILLLFIFFLDRLKIKWIKLFSYFLISFFIANVFITQFGYLNYSFTENLIYFNKYFFIFFLYILFRKILNEQAYLNQVKKLFIYIFFFNGLLALIGTIFEIPLFRIFPSQTENIRFGYNGLINAINESSIFNLLAFSIIFYEWRNKKSSFLKLIIAIIILGVSGTKTVYLAVILFFLYHFLSNISLKKTLPITLILGIIVFFIINNLSSLKNTFSFFVQKIEKKGILHTLTGGREELLINKTQFLDQIDFKYLYLTIGQNTILDGDLRLIEMDIFDIILFFGLFNGLIYIIAFKKYIVKSINTRFYFATVLIFFLISFLSGHFFTSIMNAPFILITFNFFRINKHI